MIARGIMTYDDAIQYLYGLRLFGTKLGLENTRRLAGLCGDPHRALRFIHVAGTNGKGSTCAMLEGVYRRAGLRVGLFTSPHLVSFRERIQVDRRWITRDQIVRRVSELRTLVRTHFPATGADPDADVTSDAAVSHPTFFECVTVLALLHFRDAGCDLVIWETGMGGRLDATNIVVPLASVITNVGLDHQAWLGESITDVAREKAGIIKDGVPVVSAAARPEVVAVLREVARERGAPFHLVPPPAPAPDGARLSLRGTHQELNAALATATVRVLNPSLPVSDRDLIRGLESVSWHGRLQWVEREGGVLILDGAHNADGAEALAAALKEMTPPNTPRTLILGILEDKDVSGILRVLAPGADRIEMVPVQSVRSADPRTLAETCRKIHPGAVIRAHASLARALVDTRSHPQVIVTGSLYLVGEAMALLGLTASAFDETDRGEEDERGLNEWGKPGPGNA